MSWVKNHQLTDRGAWRLLLSSRQFLTITLTIGVVLIAACAYYYNWIVEPRPRQFLIAVQSRDFVEVDRLLKIDSGLVHFHRHRRHNKLFTPLQIAIRYSSGRPRVIDRILQEKPDLNERARDGLCALHFAVESLQFETVRKLLELGADPNAADDFGRTPLDFAEAFDRKGKMTEMLVAHGADPNRVRGSILDTSKAPKNNQKS